MTGNQSGDIGGPVRLQVGRGPEHDGAVAQNFVLPDVGGVIGRGDDVDVTLSDPRVSRRHCRIGEHGEGWWVEDLGSRSGTWVDSVVLSEGERAPLQLGSLLEVGPWTFVVRGIAAAAVDADSDVLVSPETGEMLLRDIHDSSTSVRNVAWVAFDTRYGGVIRGYARRFGVRGQEEDDIVQEVYLGLHNLRDGVQYNRATGRFRNYLMVATRNAVRTRLRKSAVAVVEDIDALANPAQDALWDHQWAESMLQRALADLQRSMTPAHYDAFERYGRRGEPAAAVAECLGMTPENVRMIKHRSIRMLQKIVASYDIPGH
ncbi:MAG: sigma-70 family RNA polymerase sigma factor [Phycisphaerales bacterium]|nr:sigma-70 family RNA polymerase sigma factor [Phycisphaerales bacterium]